MPSVVGAGGLGSSSAFLHVHNGLVPISLHRFPCARRACSHVRASSMWAVPRAGALPGLRCAEGSGAGRTAQGVHVYCVSALVQSLMYRVM